MAKAKKRKFGDRFRPLATVLKTLDGIPTQIEFNGNEYFMINPAQDKKNHFTNSKARRADKRKSLQQEWRENHATNKTI